MTHSIDQYFSKMLEINSQNLKILQALTNSLTSEQDSIKVTLKNESGLDVLYELPSYAYLLRKMSEVKNNVDFLSNLNSTKKTDVILTTEPEQIKTISLPGGFSVSDNWFLSNFTSKNLNIEIDLTDKIDHFSKYVMYNRVDISIETETEKAFWNTISSRNDIGYYDLINSLKTNNISYTEEIDQFLLPALELRYSGKFSVIGILPDILKTTEYQSIRKYKFSSITYTENGTGVLGGKQLVAGDRLVTKDSKAEYFVYSVEKINNEYIVALAMRNGFETIGVGVDVLRIVSDTVGKKILKLPVNFDQYNVVFVKAIDPVYHITTDDWSDGFSFNTNSLTYKDSTGRTWNLKDYFISNVYDLGKVSMDKIEYGSIPRYEGLTPDTPVLLKSNFSVNVSNNIQKRSVKTAEIKNLTSELIRLRIENQNLNQLVLTITTQIILEQAKEVPDEALILSLTDQRTKIQSDIVLNNNTIQAYSTQITSTKTEYNNTIEAIPATYAVKGFWSFPNRKLDAKNRFQDVIGFKVQYRYLDLFDNPTCNVKIKFEELSGEVRDAIFSEWKELRTEVREKVWDSNEGNYVWEFQDLEKNVPNVNQVEIPITPYEKVEIRVKAISEAGYPENPLMSDWSASVFIDFPDAIVSTVFDTSVFDSIVEESMRKELEDKMLQLDAIVADLYQGAYKNIFQIMRYTITSADITNKTVVLTKEVDESTLMIFDEDEGIVIQKSTSWSMSSDHKTITFSDQQVEKFTAGNQLLILYKLYSQG